MYKKKQMAKYFAVIWHGGNADARLCSDLFPLFAISFLLKRPIRVHTALYLICKSIGLAVVAI